MKYRAGNGLVVVLIGIIMVASLVGSTSYRSTLHNLLLSLIIVIPVLALLLGFTYLRLDKHTLEYVNILIQREAIDVSTITRITRGKNVILFSRTYVYYVDNGKEKRLTIYDSFSEHTMHKFMGDIKNLNPNIVIGSA